MAHHLYRESFRKLADRLNAFPLGGPPGELLYKILEMLFTPRDAELVAKLPLRSFDEETASRVWDLPQPEARKILDHLADQALLLDIEHEGRIYYTLPPPMAGFFEFALMRVRVDVDQKALSELFYQYINQEDAFVLQLIGGAETQIGRVLVDEEALFHTRHALHVLSFDRASEILKKATAIGVGLCYCRHKMQHLGRVCQAPLDVCLTLNGAAESLIRHGHVNAIGVDQALERLARARSHHLVQFAENVQDGLNFICNCCGCCCEAMIAARKFWMLHPVHTSPFFPVVLKSACRGCGRCQQVCPVAAMGRTETKTAQVDLERCLGCGVCVHACSNQALTLDERPERVLTPVNSAHRVVLMAIERGKLSELLFDRRELLSHRILATVFSVILKLPPVKAVLASQQIRSRFLAWLFSRKPIYG